MLIVIYYSWVLMGISQHLHHLTQAAPDNVMVVPWVPQQAVLAHDNTRVFITHCGMHGVLESIYYKEHKTFIAYFGVWWIVFYKKFFMPHFISRSFLWQLHYNSILGFYPKISRCYV